MPAADNLPTLVLFRLKSGITRAQISQWSNLAQGMVGKIPGLITLSANPPVPFSAFRSKGFDMGIVAVLESSEHLVSYATHPAHLVFV